MNHRDAQFVRRKSVWRGVFGAVVFLALMITTSSVHAQVVSATARYEQGILMVYGATAKPRQYVQLNRFRITRSNRRGGFLFRHTRFPKSCVVRLRSAGQTREVPIKNCPLRTRQDHIKRVDHSKASKL